jgi:hypothetical protein
MKVEVARQIIAQAKSDETYEAPMPDDDAKAVSEAEALIEMARVAWNQNVHGPEVEALLRIADDNFGGNGNGNTSDDSESDEAPADDISEAV